MSDLVGNPEDRFSRVEARMTIAYNFPVQHSFAIQLGLLVSQMTIHFKLSLYYGCLFVCIEA